MKNYPMIDANKKLWHDWEKILYSYFSSAKSLMEWWYENRPPYVEYPSEKLQYTLKYFPKGEEAVDKAVVIGKLYMLNQLNLNQYLLTTDTATYIWSNNIEDLTTYGQIDKVNKTIILNYDSWELFQRRFSNNISQIDLDFVNIASEKAEYSTENNRFAVKDFISQVELESELNHDTLNSGFYIIKKKSDNSWINTSTYEGLSLVRIGTTILCKHRFTGNYVTIKTQRKDPSNYLYFKVSDGDVWYPQEITYSSTDKVIIHFKYYEKGTEKFGTLYPMFLDPYYRRWLFSNKITWKYDINALVQLGYLYNDLTSTTTLLLKDINNIPWNGQPIISELINYQEQDNQIVYEEVIANTYSNIDMTNIDNHGYWTYTINMKNDKTQNSGFDDFNTHVVIC